MARTAGPPTTPTRSATATLVLPGFANTTPPPPPGRTLPEMPALVEPASTSTPAPIRSRRKRRRVIGLVVVLVVGVVGGGAAAVLEDVLTTTPAHALATRAVVRALHPLGTQLMASRAFAADVTDSSGFGGDVVYHGAGSVTASIDFAQIDPHDVRVISADDNPRVRVRLPDVELGAPVLDEGRSGVTERHDGIFFLFFGPTVSEDDLRGEALDDLATQADASTLRAEARGIAVIQVRNKIVGLGAKAVQVEFASHG